MNLTPLRVHHDGNREPFLIIQPPHALDDPAVPLARAVAHVDPRDVHAPDGEGLQLLEPAGGGADGADELGAARAPEAILLQLRLRHGVDVDRAGVGRRGRGGASAVVRGGEDRGAQIRGRGAADLFDRGGEGLESEIVGVGE